MEGAGGISNEDVAVHPPAVGGDVGGDTIGRGEGEGGELR